MLQFSEQGIVVATTVYAPQVSASDLWVEGEAFGGRYGQRVLMEIGITRQTPLISQRCYEIVPQIILGIEGVVMGARGGQGAREDLHVHGAGGWQAVRAKRSNGGLGGW